ncbi:hypothetical protein PMAYCL1PPCAC_08813 [Pristionchus mayeri]|uniref:tRNA (guanine-N(7)-)-methyltransferase n=1 Tax=Pristionchus mayeri TaxID=1317129 RepID=A0AAN4ZCG5_9BILA|nr:hypothetical protein PMAYCL1PPCAC_08813 [Pristionchus mayeri]
MSEPCTAEAATATIEMDGVKIVEDEEDQLPQKKHYRQRAHSNPHSDHDLQYPTFPAEADWSEYFGEYATGREVTFADVGCGYGGLLVRLSPMFPDELMVGIEIRVKVSDYVIERIKALRAQSEKGKITAGGECGYKNVTCIRSNAMKYLPNFFRKAQLKKMFILFPDPHFKKQKHKWRIVSAGLLAEYAYVIRPGGKLYTITDVEDLHVWMVRHLEAHPLFRRLTQTELDADPVVGMLYESTEEGQKVTRMEGKKFPAVFERIPDPEWL